MGTLYLVRHGQASFGADDYDQLSDLGARQCRRLGEYFRDRGRRFDTVLSGRLRRHRQSWEALREGLGGALPEPEVMAGLDEYDSDAVVRAIHPEPLAGVRDPAAAKQHFRLLRQGLLAWMDGQSQPVGMPTHAEFKAGVQGALTRALADHDRDVLVVSSGGPISTALGLVLGLAPEAVVELNMRIRNSALCELAASPKRHSLLTFNTLPHLDTPEHAGWVTYA